LTDKPRHRLLLLVIAATALIFLLIVGAYFALPQLRPSGGETAGEVVMETNTPTPTPISSPTAPPTSSPIPPPTSPSTPWPTVTPEELPPVETPVVAVAEPESLITPVSDIVPLTGSGLVQLTTSRNLDYTPTLSSDQRRLVYSSKISGVWQLVEVDVNGFGSANQITFGSINYEAPHFSPDGQHLLASVSSGGGDDIYLLDSRTGAIIDQLTNLPGDEYYPHWLADGTGFIFSWQNGNDRGIYFQDMNFNRVELIHSSTFNGFAYPSPDGRQIAFYSGRDGDYEIYVMNTNGSNQRRLTFSPGRDASPVWSPDGQWIAFESERNGNYDLFAIRPDGSDLRQLTSGSENDWLPVFSADGQWLLFQSDRAGGMDIFRMPFAP